MKSISIDYRLPDRFGTITLTSKVTFIQGDSGTGKSTLVEDWAFLFKNSQNIKASDGYTVIPLIDILPISNKVESILNIWKEIVPNNKVVFFCDEDCDYITTSVGQAAIVKSPYIFLIVRRNKFAGIPHDYRDIKKLCMSKDGEYYLENLYDDYDDLAFF